MNDHHWTLIGGGPGIGSFANPFAGVGRATDRRSAHTLMA